MPFLLIHGLGQTSEAWEETRRLLPFGDVLCPDLVHLLDGAPAAYETLYPAFAAYCDALPQPLHLCGLSLGGVLALQYAAERPARTTSLVLIGTPYRIPRRLLAMQSGIPSAARTRFPADGILQGGGAAAVQLHGGAHPVRLAAGGLLPCARLMRREGSREPRRRAEDRRCPAPRLSAAHPRRRTRGQPERPCAARAGARSVLDGSKLTKRADAAAYARFLSDRDNYSSSCRAS